MTQQPRRNVVKDVTPQGDVLNDNGVNVDHLGHVVYAEALADQIKRIKTPVTIGLFARWGSGKSFLLKHIQSKIFLSQEESGENAPPKIFLREHWSFFAILLATLISFALFFVFVFYLSRPFLSIVFLFLCFALLLLSIFGSGVPWNWFPFSKVLFYAYFTKLPIKSNCTLPIRSIPPTDYKLKYKKSDTQKVPIENGSSTKKNAGKSSQKDAKIHEEKVNKRFIFVNYNAWHFAGCDYLWAGIVKALAEEIEDEFGVFTTRLFRSISLDTVPEQDSDAAYSKQSLLFLEFADEVFETDERPDEKSFKKRIKELNGEPKPISCEPNRKKRSATQNDNKVKCWELKFKNAKDAHKAYKNWKQFEDVKVTFSLPTAPNENHATDQETIKFDYRIRNVLAAVMLVLILSCSIAFAVVAFQSTSLFHGVAVNEEQSIAIKILAIIPAAFAVLIKIGQVGFALYNSQEKRINDILLGAKKSVADELGFMNKIKQEIEKMTQLVQTVNLVYDISYKVVITVDDLDRVPLPKVKSVLEAINILLSDRSSPFVCVIAIDSRVAIDCFALDEDRSCDAPGQSRPIVNGHEYLKKIINVPFCLPEIDDDTKRMYVMGLIEEADITAESREKFNEPKSDGRPNSADDVIIPNSDDDVEDEVKYPSGTFVIARDSGTNDGTRHPPPPPEPTPPPTPPPSPTPPTVLKHMMTSFISESDSNSEKTPLLEKNFSDRKSKQPKRQDLSAKTISEAQSSHLRATSKTSTRRPHHQAKGMKRAKEDKVKRAPIDFGNFLFSCRHLMYQNEDIRRHMYGNPRNIKRIFNIISLTASVVRAIQERGREDFKKRYFRRRNAVIIKQETEADKKDNAKFAEEILYWILLTDQWPFRMSYILEVIEDADQRESFGNEAEAIPETTSLLEIYQGIVMGSEKELVESYTKLLCLDGDLDLLYGLLERTQTLLTKAKAKELIKYTTNLDTNLRKSIALQRSSLFQEEKFEVEDDVLHVEADGVPSSFTASDTQNYYQRPYTKPMKIQLTEKRELPMAAGEVIRMRKKQTNLSF